MWQDADPFNLKRFITAQETVYPAVLTELKHGRKTSHWMWFIFPQIAGLGHSSTAVFYSIINLAEADAYLHHPVLGPRLLECCGLLLQMNGRSAHEIFGFPDDRKLQSSLTLFSMTPHASPLFLKLLSIYYAGEKDSATLDILSRQSL